MEIKRNDKWQQLVAKTCVPAGLVQACQYRQCLHRLPFLLAVRQVCVRGLCQTSDDRLAERPGLSLH